jgi:hypothetical protein
VLLLLSLVLATATVVTAAVIIATAAATVTATGTATATGTGTAPLFPIGLSSVMPVMVMRGEEQLNYRVLWPRLWNTELQTKVDLYTLA